MREFEIKPRLERILLKLVKKNKTAYEALMSKIEEVVDSHDVEHYKNLKHELKDKKRVRVMKSFVLVFKYDKANDFIFFLDYDHHDNIYK